MSDRTQTATWKNASKIEIPFLRFLQGNFFSFISTVWFFIFKSDGKKVFLYSTKIHLQCLLTFLIQLHKTKFVVNIVTDSLEENGRKSNFPDLLLIPDERRATSCLYLYDYLHIITQIKCSFATYSIYIIIDPLTFQNIESW